MWGKREGGERMGGGEIERKPPKSANSNGNKEGEIVPAKAI